MSDFLESRFSWRARPGVFVLFLALSMSLLALPAAAQTGENSAGVGARDFARSPSPEVRLANGLFLTGNLSYQYGSGTVRILADRVDNTRSSGTSGTLRLSLWATTTPPIFGQSVSGFLTATYTLGQLQGGFSFVNVNSGLVPFTQPPTGTYYFTIFLDEFSGGSFGYQDFAITSPLQTFGTSIGACFSNSTTLCLAGGRFRVNVGWQALNLGTSGAGQAVPLTSDTGYFYFFSSNNIELVIKVVDGRVVNNHFWVFFGALSDVQYLITVTDTVTGVVRIYHGVSGTQTALNDTSAF